MALVDESYLLEKLPPPSKLKVFIDTKLIPAAIDAAGSVELQLEQAAVAARNRPAQALGCAIGMGFLITMMLMRRRR